MRRHLPAAKVGGLVAAVVLAVPASAAAEPGQTDRDSATITASAAGAAADTPDAAVPFTGLDLALILGGGAGLICAGAGLRRAAGARA